MSAPSPATWFDALVRSDAVSTKMNALASPVVVIATVIWARMDFHELEPSQAMMMPSAGSYSPGVRTSADGAAPRD